MSYTIKPTPQFKRDYRRARQKGLDMGPLNRLIAALAAGEALPSECRDRALTGDMSGYRECMAGPDRLLVYRLDGNVLTLYLIRTGSRGELYHREGVSAMKPKKALRTLVRSPLKTAVTLLLLAAAAFLFLYNLGEYSVSDREYREARDQYEGVLTLDGEAIPDNTQASYFDFFLQTDETGRTVRYGTKIWDEDPALTYENFHKPSLEVELVNQLSTLPHISRVEKRYLTAGVSPDYTRLDTDHHFVPFAGRAVIVATVQDRYLSGMMNDPQNEKRFYQDRDSFELATLVDVELLAGDPAWLYNIATKRDYDQHKLFLEIFKEELRDDIKVNTTFDYGTRRATMTTENMLFTGDADIIRPGRRVVLVVWNNIVQPCAPVTELQSQYESGYYHRFDVGDDSLLGWWPYFTDVTDLPEGWLETGEFADLRELIRVTNDDVHTFDVVYGDDMAAQRRVAEGRIVCEEGRFIGPEDAGQPVCVVSTDFLEMSGLKIGDSITLDLGNYLSEQYAPLGAVAVTRGRQNTEYTRQEFTIIGSWRDLSAGRQVYQSWFWCWSNNAIFVPSAFLPECRNAEGHEFKPGEISFVVGNAEEIIPFMEECLPILDEMGISYVFSDGGWSAVGQDLMQARTIALVKLLVFGGAAVFALVLTVWLFIGRKKREYAIYRALGMPQRGASMQLYIPFLMLGGVSAVVGAVAARIMSLRQLAASSVEVATAHTPAGPGLYVLGTFGFLLVLAAFAWGGILLIRRRSVLELLQGDGGRRRAYVSPERGDAPVRTLGQRGYTPDADRENLSVSRLAGDGVCQLPCEGSQSPRRAFASPERGGGPLAVSRKASGGEVSPVLGGSRSRNWGGRYLRRLLGRNLGRSTLSLMLAALLAFAFGLVTVLRGIYAEAYRNVEVKPVISGGLSYDRAVKIAESGYVRDPYYERVCQNGQVEMENAVIVLTNRLERWTADPVVWLDGWDAETAMNAEDRVMVMYAPHAEELGVSLGDRVRVNETDWWNNVTAMGLDPLKPGETDMDRRDARRPFFRVVGLIQSERQEKTAFIPAADRRAVLFLNPNQELDIAEYTLIDYHQAAEFSDYVKGQLDRNQTAVKFTMDTSYADRMYKIHRLIEALYPLAVGAALLLGGVLPGLIVLHSSREISILRALGVRARDCVILYTLAEILCALSGLVLGIAMVLVLLHPDRAAVIVPFALYAAAHLAACGVGSGVFAWLCARKRVLEQLQARE